MTPFSVTCVKERYSFLLPHDYMRVLLRNAYITDMYNRVKMMGSRLIDAMYLVRYVTEVKVGATDSSFRIIDEIIESSDNYVKTIQAFPDSLRSNENLKDSAKNFIAGHILKIVADAPGKMFIKIKDDRPQLKKEDVENALEETFNLPKNYFLIKEITGTEIILSNLSLDEIKLYFRRETDELKRLNTGKGYTFMHHMNCIAEKLYATIFNTALNMLTIKMCRLFKELENLFQTIIKAVKERGREDAFDQIKYTPTWKTYPEWYLLMKYPKSKEFDLGPHIGIITNRTIKPFQKIMDKLILRDKNKRPVTDKKEEDYSAPLKDYDEENLDLPVPIDLQRVQSMVRAEKGKNLSVSVNNTTRLPDTSDRQSISNFSKKQIFAKEFKEIIGYGNTMNSLHLCFEKRIRDKESELSDIPTLIDASVKGKSYTHKIRRLLAKVKTGDFERKTSKSVNINEKIVDEESVQAEMDINIPTRPASTIMKPNAKNPHVRVFRQKITSVKYRDTSYYIPQSANAVASRSRVIGALNNTPDTRSMNRTRQRSTSASYQISAGVRGRCRSAASSRHSMNLSKDEVAKMTENIHNFILSPN